MTEPKFDRICLALHEPLMNPVSITRKAYKLLRELLGIVKQVKTQSTYNQFTVNFWVKVLKGTLRDYGNFAEEKREGYVKSHKEFVKNWNSSFPDNEYWHNVIIVEDNGYIVVRIDEHNIVYVEPEEKHNWSDRDPSLLLSFLIDEAKNFVEMVANNTYTEYLTATVPYKYRHGVINRAKLWEIDKKYKKHDLENLTKSEIGLFLQNSPDMEEEQLTARLTEMTANKWFDICSLCYTAAKYDIKNMSPREQYKRFSDNRDGGLRDLEGDSEEVFENWYHNVKNDYHSNNSHLWEISMGSSYTRIHLYLDHDDNGYFLMLSGGIHCNQVEVVRMFNALKANNLPVFITCGIKLKKFILGEDNVGLVSDNDTPYAYWYGGFDDSDANTFMRLPENADEIIKNAKWFDFDNYELASLQEE